MSRILSIDVAIKHLAFCLLENNKIKQWDLVNLIHDDALVNNFKCIHCKNPAKLLDIIKSQGYCGVHKSRAPSTDVIEIKTPSDILCLNLGCKKKIKYYYVEPTGEILGYCDNHNIITKTKRLYTVDNITDYELRVLLFTKLDLFAFDKMNIDIILIEKQPKKATEKIRSLQYALYDYFVIKFNYSNKLKIDYVDARGKLLVYDGPILKCTLKNQYDRNKWFACKYCEYNLNKLNESTHLTYFLSNNKKDDIADAYLQGIFYSLYKGRKMPMSAQSRDVLFEKNINKYKKSRCRKYDSASTKNITLSELKYIITKNIKICDKKLCNALDYFFGVNSLVDFNNKINAATPAIITVQSTATTHSTTVPIKIKLKQKSLNI